MNVSPEALAAILLTITGAVLSLAFRFIPKLKAWYDTQEDKGPIMFAAVVASALAYSGLSCKFQVGRNAPSWPILADPVQNMA